MFKSYYLLALMIVVGLSSTAYSADAIEALESDSVSNAYAQLIHAEHQLLNSELAIESKKSANFEKLLAGGHASWSENRQQKLVVDILYAKLAAYEQFESQAQAMLAGGKINFESMKTESTETRLATIQELQKELTELRQKEEKLARGVATLPINDPWLEGYRLRHALARHQSGSVAARIVLLERLNASSDGSNEPSKMVSTADQASTFTATWKRPSKDSRFMQLMITQAELQMQLSQHHLSNETQRLASLQELVDRGMATEQSIAELKNNVDEIRALLTEQQNNFAWLKKKLDASPDTGSSNTSVQVRRVSGENAISNESPLLATNSSVLQSVLNHFESGQAEYLRREAILKGDMYREILGRLEQAVAIQTQQVTYNQTSAGFSDILIRGQQRELDQYRWKIKKTELQRELADAQIALLKEPDGGRSDNLNMLVSTGIRSSSPRTIPSRFQSNDPFGLQTTYSAFVYNSPVFKARRPALSTRADLSASSRPILNRDALSSYLDRQSSRLRSSYGGFNRVHSYGYLNPGFRRPGQPPWYLPGSRSAFGTNRSGGSFGGSSHYNSFGRSTLHHGSSRNYGSPVSSYYGR